MQQLSYPIPVRLLPHDIEAKGRKSLKHYSEENVHKEELIGLDVDTQWRDGFLSPYTEICHKYLELVLQKHRHLVLI